MELENELRHQSERLRAALAAEAGQRVEAERLREGLSVASEALAAEKERGSAALAAEKQRGDEASGRVAAAEEEAAKLRADLGTASAAMQVSPPVV